MKTKITILIVLLAVAIAGVLVVSRCFGEKRTTPDAALKKELTMKKNLGSKLALYPMPLTVVGANVGGKANWLLVAHVGIIGHDRILVSMSQSHYTNQGIKANKVLSVNLVDEKLLQKADYVGSVSGANTDKSNAFEYHLGESGAPVIDASPLVLELRVEDNYETKGFDNFICTIDNTYADESILDAEGKIDYNVLKPVLFEFPTYMYLRTGDVIGKCLNLNAENMQCAKLPQTEQSIVRLSKIEIFPERLEEYKVFAKEVGEISMCTEPGVLAMYGMEDKDNPCRITILEIYSDPDAYKSHIASPHFQKYKAGTLDMVKSLELDDQNPMNPKMKLR